MQKSKPSQSPQNIKFEAPVEFTENVSVEEPGESVSPFYGFDESTAPDDDEYDDDYALPGDSKPNTETVSTETTEYYIQSTPNNEIIVTENPLTDVSHTIEVTTTTSPKKRKVRSADASGQPSGGKGKATRVKPALLTPKDDNLKKPAKRRIITPKTEPGKSDQDAVSFLIENLDASPSLKHQDDASKAVEYERRKHKCQVCGKRFFGKSNLVDHLRFHANVKPFKCDHCDKSFTQSGSLRCHTRTHTNEKPFVCQICQKAFNQTSSLKIHIRSHTQERTHVCEVCSKKFLSNSDLSKHRHIHDEVKRFQCELCNMGFAQNINYRKHMQSKHSDLLDGSKKKKAKIEADTSPKVKPRKVIDVMARLPKLLNKSAETKPEGAPIRLLNNDRKPVKKSGGIARIIKPDASDEMTASGSPENN